MMALPKDLNAEIKEIFDKNTVDDLKTFMGRRHCLNVTNSYLIYLFHLVQSAGILTTSIAASTNDSRLIWIGVALNISATLITVYEKTNNGIMKKLMNDIKAIKAGVYVDEGAMIEPEAKDCDDKPVQLKEPLLSPSEINV